MIKKKILQAVLTIAVFTGFLAFSTSPVNATSSAKLIDSGSAGASITWSMYDNGELKFTGSGDMNNYLDVATKETNGQQGWYKYRRDTKKIYIGQGITSIGDGAFFDFPESSIVWPSSSLTSIGVASFANNTSLAKIDIPASVTSIDEAAFKNCSAASVININGSVSVISEEAFTGMSDANIYIASGCTKLMSKSLYGSASRVEFPATVTYVASNAMDKNNKWQLIKSSSDAVKLYANNNYIPYIDATKTYTITSKNVTLESSSYSYTGKTIIPDIKVTYNDGDESALLVKDTDYVLILDSDKSKSLGTHTVEVKGIGSFTGSITLKYKIIAHVGNCSIKLSYTCVAADGKAKKPAVTVKCNGLALKEGTHYVVTYENNVEPGTATVTIKGKSKNFIAGSQTVEFTIFEKKRFYYDDCIYIITKNTDSVKEVMLADADVDSKKFEIPDTVEYDGEDFDVVEIGQYAFKNSNIVQKVIVGSNVRKISTGAFFGCKNLTNITLPNSLLVISDKAFINCVKLKGVTIPAKVKSIGAASFSGCKALVKINIKTDLLTTSNVGTSAFKNINKKAVIYCHNSVLSKYKALFKKKGFNQSTQKILPLTGK